jgi:hypothetical protein
MSFMKNKIPLDPIYTGRDDFGVMDGIATILSG